MSENANTSTASASPWTERSEAFAPQMGAGKSTPSTASAGSGSVLADSSPAPEPQGLGTAWGESRESRIGFSQFQRAGASPNVVSSVYYNAESTIREIVGDQSARRGFMYAGKGIEWRVESFGGLPWWQDNSRRYVAGREGQRYTLAVRNTNRYRVEAVLTVDGLDVMDGKSGSYRKRGYIIEPGSTLTVDGFRQSTQSVAAFRFSAISASYANLRHGDTRNVGVIGLAVFEPRVVYRDNANPFPGNPYAQPPRHSVR